MASLKLTYSAPKCPHLYFWLLLCFFQKKITHARSFTFQIKENNKAIITFPSGPFAHKKAKEQYKLSFFSITSTFRFPLYFGLFPIFLTLQEFQARSMTSTVSSPIVFQLPFVF